MFKIDDTINIITVLNNGTMNYYYYFYCQNEWHNGVILWVILMAVWRVCAGRKIVGSTISLARSEFLSKKAKLAIRRAVLLPTLLYGSETWVCQAKHVSRVNAVDMSLLRGVCGKTRWDRVRNEDVRRECGVSETAYQVHEKSVLRWFGHVERMNGERLTKQIYVGGVDGTRGKGRPRKTWLNAVGESLSNKSVLSTKNKRKCMTRKMDVKEAREVCKDRKEWKKVCASRP